MVGLVFYLGAFPSGDDKTSRRPCSLFVSVLVCWQCVYAHSLAIARSFRVHALPANQYLAIVPRPHYRLGARRPK
jgi:hypothetical protein